MARCKTHRQTSSCAWRLTAIMDPGTRYRHRYEQAARNEPHLVQCGPRGASVLPAILSFVDETIAETVAAKSPGTERQSESPSPEERSADGDQRAPKRNLRLDTHAWIRLFHESSRCAHEQCADPGGHSSRGIVSSAKYSEGVPAADHPGKGGERIHASASPQSRYHRSQPNRHPLATPARKSCSESGMASEIESQPSSFDRNE